MTYEDIYSLTPRLNLNTEAEKRGEVSQWVQVMKLKLVSKLTVSLKLLAGDLRMAQKALPIFN
jgi:hypothetical protein